MVAVSFSYDTYRSDHISENAERSALSVALKTSIYAKKRVINGRRVLLTPSRQPDHTCWRSIRWLKVRKWVRVFIWAHELSTPLRSFIRTAAKTALLG